MDDKKLNILLLDDQGQTLRTMMILLRTPKVRLTCADHPETAIRLCKQIPFDLILCDIVNEEMSPRAMLACIRPGCAAPVILLCSEGGPKAIERSLAAGFADHLTKPASSEMIIAAANRALSGRLAVAA